MATRTSHVARLTRTRTTGGDIEGIHAGVRRSLRFRLMERLDEAIQIAGRAGCATSPRARGPRS